MPFSFRRFLDKRRVLAELGSFDEKALYIGAEDDRLECVQILLEAGINPNCRGRKHMTPLHAATSQNHLPVLRLLLAHGADIDSQDEDKHTPLMLAIVSSHKHAFDTLLQEKPDLEATNYNGDTALGIAIQSGETTLARKLIDADAEIDIPNHEGKTPLMMAIEEEKIGIVKSLLANGADPNVKDHDGLSVLDMQIASPRIRKMIKRYSMQHRISDSPSLPGYTRYLATDTYMMPLADQVFTRFPKLSSLLLNLADHVFSNLDAQYHFSDMEQKGKDYLRQLEHSLEQTLAEKPANGTAYYGSTNQSDMDLALFEAIATQSMPLVRIMLRIGANPNAQDPTGQTPLHVAGNKLAFVKMLLKNGADPQIKNEAGISALAQAKEKNWEAVIAWMEE
ncbi:MAG: ankyrin repeat domain-containing protein [Bacteroidota bacterium]